MFDYKKRGSNYDTCDDLAIAHYLVRSISAPAIVASRRIAGLIDKERDIPSHFTKSWPGIMLTG